MSETDDTDELLLMPPHIDDIHILDNHFAPYYQIVDKLITQVSKLKTRITSIENSSDVSLGSITNSVDTFLNMMSSDSSNNTCRRCYSFESLPQHSEHHLRNTLQCFSTQSTPQKPRSKLMLNSFPNSPKQCEELRQFRKPLYRGKVVRDKIEEGDGANGHEFHRQPVNIIKEIDDFLSNVKPSRKSDAVRNLDFDKLANDFSEKQNRTLSDVQQILKEMEKQEEKIKGMYEEKSGKTTSDNYLLKNESHKASVDWKKGMETVSFTSADSSLTDKSTVLYQPVVKMHDISKESTNDAMTQDCGNRNNLINQPFKHNSLGTKHNDSINLEGSHRSNLDVERTVIENFSSTTNSTRRSFSSPQFDIHSSAKDALTMHKKLLDENRVPDPENYYGNSKKLVEQVNNSNLGGVSLVNLWSSVNRETEKSADKCIQKLQEEKLRRTHCEELIQQLQTKILEQQEKLAVAIQVDEAKDTAIIRFHDAWEKATMKLKLVVKEKDQLEIDIRKLASQNEKINQDCDERIEFHRKETNQAVNMAQEHQNKYEELQKMYEELSSENVTLKSTSGELENRVKGEEEKNKQLSNILADKEIELAESKNILFHAKKEVTQCQAAVESCQKDFTSIKAEHDLIQEEIKVERHKVSQMREQNKELAEELEEHRKNEKSLINSLKESQEKIESNKKELRNFYQGQVELLVQTKLKEFQKQLDDAEQKMKEELAKKEMEIAKSAAIHIQQMNDKYSLEINLLEQKHLEEMQLKEVRTAQMEQRLREIESKLYRQQDRKEDLMKQLRRVMEAQWTEAIRIINTGKSPVPLDDSSSTIDQLHSLHSKSYHNMEALLNREFEEKASNQTRSHHVNEVQCYGSQTGKRNHPKHNETVGHRSSKTKSGKPPDSDNLQKYIDLLLQKHPSNISESGEKSKPSKLFSEHPIADKSMWKYPELSSRKLDVQENGSQREENKRKSNWK